MTSKILIFDDEIESRNTLSAIFKDEPFEVTVVSLSEEFDAALNRETFDVLILDRQVGGPGGSDVDSKDILLRHCRKGLTTPVIFVTAKPDYETEDAEVDALALPVVQDYILKGSLRPKAFIARVNRLLSPTIGPDIQEKGRWRLHRKFATVEVAGELIKLSPSEFEIFDCLFQHFDPDRPARSRFVTYSKLEHLVADATDPTGLIRQRVTRLRNRLKETAAKGGIASRAKMEGRQGGYTLVP